MIKTSQPTENRGNVLTIIIAVLKKKERKKKDSSQVLLLMKAVPGHPRAWMEMYKEIPVVFSCFSLQQHPFCSPWSR